MIQSITKILVSHPTGNANLRAVLRGFADAGILNAFYTTIATQDASLFKRLSNLPGLSEFKRRSYDNDLTPLIHTYPYKELLRLFSAKAGFNSLVQHERGAFSVDKVYRSIDEKAANAIKQYGKKKFDAVYAYEDGALMSFKAAKEKSITCLYDLPIGYWRAARKLMSEEIENRPEWASTMAGFSDSDFKTNCKDEELKLADHVFVASSFTAKTLDEYPGKINSLHVIPYGFPSVAAPKKYDGVKNRKLKLLFVGGLSQRKGIADIFDAVESLQDYVELTVIGKLPNLDVPVLSKALNKHKYIPSLPHSEVLKHMYDTDVLLFPSLFEGFGLVITEAMSQGTPVICTDRTAGPDLIVHGEDGWLVKAAAAQELNDMISQLIQKPEWIESAGIAAREKASKRPWNFYGKELSDKIISLNQINENR